LGIYLFVYFKTESQLIVGKGHATEFLNEATMSGIQKS